MANRANGWLVNLPDILKNSLLYSVTRKEVQTFSKIPLDFTLTRAKEILENFKKEGTLQFKDLTGVNGKNLQKEAKVDLQQLEKFVEKWEKEIEYEKGAKNMANKIIISEVEEKEVTEVEKEVTEVLEAEKEASAGLEMEVLEVPEVLEVENEVPEVEKEEPEVENEVPEVENEVPEVENEVPEVAEKEADDEGKFKWLNRSKATLSAIKIKNENNLTPEEACKRVLAEYEGVYFKNPSLMSEKRYNNFIQRVSEDKSYKKTSEETTKYVFTQVKIKELNDKGELTDMQAVVLDELFNLLANKEWGYSDVDVNYLCKISSFEASKVKRAINSLIKKEYLYMNKVELEISGKKQMREVVMIGANIYNLYNDKILEWKEEMEMEKIKAEDEAMDNDSK